METIRAAHNLTITFDPLSWHIYNGAPSSDDPEALVSLLEVSQGFLAASRPFAQARQLPNEGQLAPADVARVVVGWAPESQNWHLGLLLAARPDTSFKMRWCGLASWPRGPQADYVNQARQAGQALARLIDRPFHLIPPARPPVNNLSDTQPLQATQRLDGVAIEANVEAAVDLQSPPFEFEEWAMNAIPKGYVWQRHSRCMLMDGVRALVHFALMVLFIVLGVGAQTRGLAKVEPAWLPWLGIAMAGVLGVSAVHLARRLISVHDVIIDTTVREVRCQTRFLALVRWRVPFGTGLYVLISQTQARAQGRKRRDTPMRIKQEVWLHLYDGKRFREIVALGSVEGESRLWDVMRQVQKTPGRRPLRLARTNSPAHQAALVMSRVIGCAVWLDVR